VGTEKLQGGSGGGCLAIQGRAERGMTGGDSRPCSGKHRAPVTVARDKSQLSVRNIPTTWSLGSL
jgi:hypothetical protein